MDPEHLPMCTACANQHDCAPGEKLTNCAICDDPRQFVPPNGQSWTSLAELKKNHKNEWTQDAEDKDVWYITTEPKFAIGQRACFVETPSGNFLWDIIGFLDQETIDKIKAKGGLKAIVISHPHYYSTYVHWGQAFNCPVWIASDDEGWLRRKAPSSDIVSLVKGPVGTEVEVVPGVKVIKAGGHFPGSLVLLYKHMLFIADTLLTVPSAYTPHPRPPGQTSYVYMWSIPNMIPLPAPEVLSVWRALKPYQFTTTHGAFMGMEVRGNDVKQRVLDSAQIQIKNEGWVDHELMRETLD